MKKKTLLALLAGIPDDANVIFEKYENEKVIKEIPYTNGEITRHECTRIDVEPSTDLLFQGLTVVETDASDEITTVSIRFTE